MTSIDQEIENALHAVNNLSRKAQAGGLKEVMYAANRAWHELYEARARLMAPATSSLRQGDQ